MLDGGFRWNLVHLLYGSNKFISNILHEVVVNFQTIKEGKIAWISGDNRFRPYEISKIAVSKKPSPSKILDNILISRAFSWERLVELVQARLPEVNNIKVIVVAGFTNLQPDHEKKTIGDLLGAIEGMKKTIFKSNPLFILTAPLNEYSDFKPKGGHALYHFGSVLLVIEETERSISIDSSNIHSFSKRKS